MTEIRQLRGLAEARTKAGRLRSTALEMYEKSAGSDNKALLLQWSVATQNGADMLSDIANQLQELREAAGCSVGVDHETVRQTIAQQTANIEDLVGRLERLGKDMVAQTNALEDHQRRVRTLERLRDRDTETIRQIREALGTPHHADVVRDVRLCRENAENGRKYRQTVCQVRELLDLGPEDDVYEAVRSLVSERDGRQDTYRISHEVLNKVLDEVREALGTPEGEDVVADARDAADRRANHTPGAEGRLADTILKVRDALYIPEGGDTVEYAHGVMQKLTAYENVLNQTRGVLGIKQGIDLVNHVYRLRTQSEGFRTEVKSALGLPNDASDIATIETAKRLKRQAEERPNWGRINGRPVTKALADLILERKRQSYSLENDRNMLLQTWVGILKGELSHLGFVVQRDKDKRTNRIRNAALRIASICLALVERLDGVTEKDIR